MKLINEIPLIEATEESLPDLTLQLLDAQSGLSIELIQRIVSFTEVADAKKLIFYFALTSGVMYDSIFPGHHTCRAAFPRHCQSALTSHIVKWLLKNDKDSQIAKLPNLTPEEVASIPFWRRDDFIQHTLGFDNLPPEIKAKKPSWMPRVLYVFILSLTSSENVEALCQAMPYALEEPQELLKRLIEHFTEDCMADTFSPNYYLEILRQLESSRAKQDFTSPIKNLLANALINILKIGCKENFPEIIISSVKASNYDYLREESVKREEKLGYFVKRSDSMPPIPPKDMISASSNHYIFSSEGIADQIKIDALMSLLLKHEQALEKIVQILQKSSIIFNDAFFKRLANSKIDFKHWNKEVGRELLIRLPVNSISPEIILLYISKSRDNETRKLIQYYRLEEFPAKFLPAACVLIARKQRDYFSLIYPKLDPKDQQAVRDKIFISSTKEDLISPDEFATWLLQEGITEAALNQALISAATTSRNILHGRDGVFTKLRSIEAVECLLTQTIPFSIEAKGSALVQIATHINLNTNYRFSREESFSKIYEQMQNVLSLMPDLPLHYLKKACIEAAAWNIEIFNFLLKQCGGIHALSQEEKENIFINSLLSFEEECRDIHKKLSLKLSQKIINKLFLKALTLERLEKLKKYKPSQDILNLALVNILKDKPLLIIRPREMVNCYPDYTLNILVLLGATLTENYIDQLTPRQKNAYLYCYINKKFEHYKEKKFYPIYEKADEIACSADYENRHIKATDYKNKYINKHREAILESFQKKGRDNLYMYSLHIIMSCWIDTLGDHIKNSARARCPIAFFRSPSDLVDIFEDILVEALRLKLTTRYELANMEIRVHKKYAQENPEEYKKLAELYPLKFAVKETIEASGIMPQI